MTTEILTRLDRIEANLSDLRQNCRETFDLAAAAQYLHLSRSHLYQLTSKEQIAHYKPGGKRLYFDKADLDAYLRRHRVEPREVA